MNLIKTVCLAVVLVLFQIIPAYAEIKPEKVMKQRWYEIVTPNFKVLADTGEKAATNLAVDLERFHAMIALFYGRELPELRPVTLIATQRNNTYDFLYGDREAARKTGGFFMDSINGNFAVVRASRRTQDSNLNILLHEYTHYFSANITTSNAPLWYREGIAEFLGETEFKDDQVINYGKPNYRHLAYLNNKSWMPLRELMGIRKLNIKEAKKDKIRKFYSQSWLFVHFLHFDPKVMNKREGFMKSLAEGDSPADAVQKVFGVDLETLDGRLKLYMKRKARQYARLTLENPLATKEISVRKLAPQEIAFNLGYFTLQARGSQEQARPFFIAALTGQDNKASALAGLANTYLGSDLAEMDRLISKAKVADEGNPWVATVSGHLNRTFMEKATNQEEVDAYWNLAIRDYNKAIIAEPTNIEAILSATGMYGNRGRWEEHLELSEVLYEIAPSNYVVRTNLILSYLRNNQMEAAAKVADLIRRHHHLSARAIEQFERWYDEQRNAQEN